MTRTGLSIVLLSVVIFITLTILFPEVMGGIILVSVLGIIFITNRNTQQYEMDCRNKR